MKYYTNKYLSVNPVNEIKKIDNNQLDLFITEANATPENEMIIELSRVMKKDSHIYFITQNDIMLDLEISKQMREIGFKRVQTLTAKTEELIETDLYSLNAYTILMFRKIGEGCVKKVNNHTMSTVFNVEDLSDLKKVLIEQSSQENEIVFDSNDIEGTTAIEALNNKRKYLSFSTVENEEVKNKLCTLKKELRKLENFDKQINRVQKADAIEELKQLPSNSVDLIVSDPPYKISKSVASFEHDDVNFKDYVTDLYRVLKEGKHAYIMTNNDHLFEFEEELYNAGFNLNARLIWEKNNIICSGYYFGQNAEYILFVSKGEPEKFDSNHLELVNFHKNTRNLFHATQKPIDLLKNIIQSASREGDIVLDPFSGSASTAISCVETDRKFITYEIDNMYHIISKGRAKEAKLRMKKEQTTCEKSLTYINRQLGDLAKEFEKYKQWVTEDKIKHRKGKKKKQDITI